MLTSCGSRHSVKLSTAADGRASDYEHVHAVQCRTALGESTSFKQHTIHPTDINSFKAPNLGRMSRAPILLNGYLGILSL